MPLTKIHYVICNYITCVLKLKHCTNNDVILVMSLWNYTNHCCVIVLIILQLNLPALYAETIELNPTRKWQLVMWGKMDFTMLWYCKGPWDNTVNIIKHCLNCFLCEMCNAWIKAYWLVGHCQQLCCAHVSLRTHKLLVSDNILYWFNLFWWIAFISKEWCSSQWTWRGPTNLMFCFSDK